MCYVWTDKTIYIYLHVRIFVCVYMWNRWRLSTVFIKWSSFLVLFVTFFCLCETVSKYNWNCHNVKYMNFNLVWFMYNWLCIWTDESRQFIPSTTWYTESKLLFFWKLLSCLQFHQLGFLNFNRFNKKLKVFWNASRILELYNFLCYNICQMISKFPVKASATFEQKKENKEEKEVVILGTRTLLQWL